METKLNIPKDGFAGLKENFKTDAISGFLVFLIALPLCIGISKASGFPAIAGIFTAIIGGLIVSPIMGSSLTIKGPAAGLIVIALGAVTDLGAEFGAADLTPDTRLLYGYQLALATIVVAGIIQVLFGLIKAGKLADFFPASAVHGMLAAIGIIIAAKQIHALMGVKPTAKAPLQLLAEIPHSVANLNPYVTIIGVVSLIILFSWPQIKNKNIKKIPGALVVLLIAIPLGFVFDLHHAHEYMFANHSYSINPKSFLVILDKSLIDSIQFPDFTHVFSGTSIKYIIMFALVGSIESLLTSKAVDGLDPFKRKSNMNKDLLAVGIGNTLAGFVGGLPMISEVVRSSANINNGAKTRWANFFHGMFLLLFVALAASLIGMIPNAALAAMLIFTGYRLASPKEFFKTYKIGPEQLIIFLTTIIVTLAEDLLMGIAAGILAKFIIHMLFGVPFRSLFKANIEVKEESKNHFEIKVKDAAIFSNYLSMKKHFINLPDKSHVVIDFSETVVIDHTFMEHLHELEMDLHERGGHVEVKGLDYHKHLSDHPLSAKRLVKGGSDTKSVVVMSPRQKRLKVFADENKFQFDHKLATNISKFSDFPYSKAHRVKYEENVLVKEDSEVRMEISDIFVEEGARHAKVEYKMTKVFLKELKVTIPEFILEEETLIDGLFVDAGLKDINFEKYSAFSKAYLLRGKDEAAIRTFFTDELLKYFEANPGYHMESKGNKLLIYKEPSIMSVEEIKHSIDFAMGFEKIIHKA